MQGKLSAEDIRRHVESGGVCCPRCGSADISGDEVDIEGGLAIQEVGCVECSILWRDIYALKSIELLSCRWHD